MSFHDFFPCVHIMKGKKIQKRKPANKSKIISRRKFKRATLMMQWMKILAPKPDPLSSIFDIHMAEGKITPAS